MSNIAISAEHLSKLYTLGGNSSGSIYDTFNNLFKSKKATPDNSFWALDDLSFDIKYGEAVGIVGRNGAGKSTLLKVLSRITQPTKGKFTINGRVASLLEVGTGFHPELSGRENIFLNGTILGMSRSEVRSKLDEIVAFSGVEKFLDTPVKHYSSGMYVRLAFAVAAHLEPEILIIDEVLAVGDAEFQKKCLGKMEQVTGEGRTVLFVSHNMNAVEQLCTSGIMLQKGGMQMQSNNIREIIRAYLNNGESNSSALWKGETSEYENECHTLEELSIHNNGKLYNDAIRNDEEVTVSIKGTIKSLDEAFNLGIHCYDEDGTLLYMSYIKDQQESEWTPLNLGDFHVTVTLPKRLLNEGKYQIEVVSGLHYRKWFIEPGTGPNVSLEIAGGLSDSPLWITKRQGILAPVLNWKSI